MVRNIRKDLVAVPRCHVLGSWSCDCSVAVASVENAGCGNVMQIYGTMVGIIYALPQIFNKIWKFVQCLCDQRKCVHSQ